MGFFECCRNCPSTKRHPGCHGKCKDYIDQKKLWDERNELIKKKRKESQIAPAKTDYLSKSVWYY